jgi:hypothetical protein
MSTTRNHRPCISLTCEDAFERLVYAGKLTQQERKQVQDGWKVFQSPISSRHAIFAAFIQSALQISPEAAFLCMAKLGLTHLGRMRANERALLLDKIASESGRFDILDFPNLCLSLGVQFSISAAPVQHCKPDAHFICIGAPSSGNIAQYEFLGVPLSLEDHEILGDAYPGFTDRVSIEALKTRLGSGFISEENGRLTVHQALMTAHLLDGADRLSAEFQPWDWVVDQVKHNSLFEYLSNIDAPRIIILDLRTDRSWHKLPESAFYYHVRTVMALHGNITLLPSETETKWAELKIGDIRALDDIANTPNKCSYRPKTCFGQSGCILSDPQQKTVSKRSHSCGAGHVHTGRSGRRSRAKCSSPGKSLDGPVWFHQEYVDSLVKFGEYRIFLCGNRVIVTARTCFDWSSEPKKLAVRPLVLDNDFVWFSSDPKEQLRKHEELLTFAKHVRSRLLKRADAREHYASLQIGVRLDIGVSKLSPDGEFFVNEITRFPSADQFSAVITPTPHLDICKAWADAVVKETRS